MMMKMSSTMLAFVVLFPAFQSCSPVRKTSAPAIVNAWDVASKVKILHPVPPRRIDVKLISSTEVTAFAEALVGVPYKFGSMRKENGLDCSGFINYVFSHFNISVPRTTIAFTNAGQEVSIRDSRRGDIILFTGSDATSGAVGHMGIVTENKKNSFWFIHSSSGKGVIVSTLNSYFIPRFVKVIRIFQ